MNNVEIYDPAQNTWTAGPSLTTGRTGHTATVLPDGKVLIAGGTGTSFYLRSTEVYDPAKNSWTAGADMAGARYLHMATLLLNGKVLFATSAGSSASAELYDTGLGNSTAWQPVISTASTPLNPGGTFAVTGDAVHWLSERVCFRRQYQRFRQVTTRWCNS